jgi:hypothetical protein
MIDEVATEERIALDLPWQGVADVVLLAMEYWNDLSVRDVVANRMCNLLRIWLATC